MNLFAYGTLMFPSILQAVTGTWAQQSRPALLSAFTRRQVRGQAYPAIVPQPMARVDGCVYLGLPEQCLLRLDAFEGPEYRRERHILVRADGLRVVAWCYVFRPELRRRLLPEDWDPAGFRDRHLKHYLDELNDARVAAGF